MRLGGARFLEAEDEDDGLEACVEVPRDEPLLAATGPATIDMDADDLGRTSDTAFPVPIPVTESNNGWFTLELGWLVGLEPGGIPATNAAAAGADGPTAAAAEYAPPRSAWRCCVTCPLSIVQRPLNESDLD